MNADELKAKWNEIKDKLRQKWAELSENDWHQTGSDKDKIIRKVQEKYGIAKEQAEKEFHDLFKKKKRPRPTLKKYFIPNVKAKNASS